MPETSEEKQAPASVGGPPEKEGGNGEQAPKKRSRVVISKSSKKLLTKVLKRLGLGFLAEIIPWVGDVAPGWIIPVYLHLKDSPAGFVSPLGLIIFPLAVVLDAIGFLLICFGLDDFWITDAIGLVFIAVPMIISVIFQTITGGGGIEGEEAQEETQGEEFPANEEVS
jgi:hypothetical protein